MSEKTYQTFIQTHLSNWFECIHHHYLQNTSSSASTPSTSQNLFSNIYTTGAELLFNFDVLRQSQGPPLTSVLPKTLQTFLLEHSTIALPSLPCLFSSFLQSVRRYKGALFNQSSSGAAVEVRTAGMIFFAHSIELVDQVEAGDSNMDLVWETKLKLLEIIDREMLFNANAKTDVTEILKAIGNNATEAIGSSKSMQAFHVGHRPNSLN